jgi:hypothetical protein
MKCRKPNLTNRKRHRDLERLGVGVNPRSEVKSRHLLPSFAELGSSDLDAASLMHTTATVKSHAKHDELCLALNLGSRDHAFLYRRGGWIWIEVYVTN